jgi:hypothetical protein
MRSCQTRLCRRHGQTGSSKGKVRSALQSRWASVLSHTVMQMSPRATVPGHRQSSRPRSPASRNGTGHLPFANRAGCERAEIVLSAHGSCEQAGPVGWGERVTCDELIQVPVTSAARGEPTSRASGWAGCFGREGTPGICPGRPRGAGRGPGRYTWPGAPSLQIGVRPEFRVHVRLYPLAKSLVSTLSSLDGRGRPALSQNPKLRRRAPPGVRRGHPAGRPEPTRRLLSALRGVLLPFAHGFDDSDRDPLKLMSSKVGQCRARFACWVRNISS